MLHKHELIFLRASCKMLLVIFMDYLSRDTSSLNLPTNWHATNSVGKKIVFTSCIERRRERKKIYYLQFPFSPSELGGRNRTSGLTVSPRISSSCCSLEYLMLPLHGVKFPWHNVPSTKKECKCHGVETGPVSPLLSFCTSWLCYCLIIQGLRGDSIL